MRKESRSQTRGGIARQQTQGRAVETVASPRKQSRKASTSTPGTPSKDTKSVSKNRSTSVSSGRSRDTKQMSASDIASHDTAVSPTTIQQQPDPNISGSAQGKVSSARKEKPVSKTPDKRSLKSRRWVRGGPIEYSTPPSDHSSDKTGIENVADKQKSSADSHDGTRGKSSSKKNIALAFDGSDKGADVKLKYKDSDSVPSTAAGGKRKKNAAQWSLTTESKSSLISVGSSRKNAQSSADVKVEEPEPIRTKRMARLNAEAIVSLIYKHDEPVAKSSKFRDSDSDVDTDSSEFSSEEEHTPAAKRSRAKPSPSRQELAGTAKNEGERGGHSSNKKRELQSSPGKRNSRQLDRSSKSQPKVCKKKSVEAVLPSSWSPPKRMASLNAQVCFHT